MMKKRDTMIEEINDSTESEVDMDNSESSETDTNSESEDEGSGENAEGNADEKVKEEDIGNQSWAEVMGQILRVGTRSQPRKTMVLSKAKKLSTKPVIKTEESESPTVPEDRAPSTVLDPNHKLWLRQALVKPDVLEKDYEKSLQKIAVKGVVQLFNAVRTHQKSNAEVEEKKKNEKRAPDTDKVLSLIKDKRRKLDELDIKEDDIKEESENEEEKAGNYSTWNVLKDNFLLDAKLKNWDKTEESHTAQGHNSLD